MSRGQPDYGMYAAKAVTTSISDMGEVAARLGSIDIYDKRGDVVEFDNFEEPVVRWVDWSTGDSYTRLSSLNARSGSQSLYLRTDSVSGRWANIQRGVSVLGSKRLGIEISLCKLRRGTVVSLRPDFYFGLDYYDGAKEHFIQARLDATQFAAKLSVYNAAETYEKVTDLVDLHADDFFFYTLKLVADFDTDKYVRILFANIEYDISDITLWTDVIDTAPKIVVNPYLENPTNDYGEVWLDDYILTQAEP